MFFIQDHSTDFLYHTIIVCEVAVSLCSITNKTKFCEVLLISQILSWTLSWRQILKHNLTLTYFHWILKINNIYRTKNVQVLNFRVKVKNKQKTVTRTRSKSTVKNKLNLSLWRNSYELTQTNLPYIGS